MSLKNRVGIRYPRPLTTKKLDCCYVLSHDMDYSKVYFHMYYHTREQKSHNIKKPDICAFSGYSALQAVSVYIVVPSQELIDL